MEEIKKSYYAIIPANVRYDKELIPNAKLLYGEITALCNEKGYCWANNLYFAELYSVSKTSISKWISNLENKGYINTEIVYKEGTKEILNRYIKIVTTPIEEKLNTPLTKVDDPIEEKLKDNNIYNNTYYYNDDDIKQIFSFYDKNIGQMSSYVAEELQSYFDDFNKDMILLALKKTADNGKHTINYVKAILNNWNKNNIHTISEVQNYDEQKTNKKENKTNQKQGYNNSNTRDYNFDDNNFYAN